MQNAAGHYINLGCSPENTASMSSTIREIAKLERNLDIDLWPKRKSYPLGFPNLKSTISGHTVNILSWKSLEQNEFIDDVIINSYLQLICGFAQSNLNFNVVFLDVHLVQNIIFDQKLGAFGKWLGKIDLRNYEVLLIPINAHEHWTLLVAVPKLKLIIYLDSKHGKLNSGFFDRICAFLQLYWQPGKRLSYKQWTLFTPEDIPTQFRLKGSKQVMTMNCGPHLVSWSHIICSGKPVEFNDSDMDSVRCRLAEILLKNNGIDQRTSSHKRRMVLRNERDKGEILLTVRRTRMVQQSSLPILGCKSIFDLCASLHKL
ncbi:hypothetical protein QAD02_008290 [Eretmocerus hayati]|uniref:Uncharacterized protein n=1 Tax=Eretmocerus hayati TaxID=131215 RepID=A0ACC2N6N1_9HYME|nr:hypothetical protein QAD02_008290 [Eretmocerus hayati]